MDPSRTAEDRRIEADIVCTSCGCLCDDIELEIQADRIVEARNACAIGRDRFLRDRGDDEAGCRIGGGPATFEEAIERAARILAGARSPLVFGLDRATIEGQRAAVSLAGAIGGCIDVPGGSATVEALQSVGEVTCTLGEIKNRADLILIWRADPVETHPRLLPRYALNPAGTFLPGGRRDRFCAIIDVRETRSFAAADQSLRISVAGEVAALWTLRALARGITVGDVKTITGIPLVAWKGLMERMRGSRYGAIFYGASVGGLVARGLHSLARELNDTTRFICMPLSPGGNGVGARNVMTWRTGFPGAVRFSEGQPRFGPGEFDAPTLLRDGAVDAALVISGDPTEALDDAGRERLSRIPRVVLVEDRSPAVLDADIVIRTASFGIETTGTVYRMDGVPLPLRAVLAPRFPAVADVLWAIESRVRSIAAPDREGRA